MTMLHLALISGLVVVTIGALLVTEALRDGRRRLLLALAIPVLMAWPFAIYGLGNRLLGYAADSALPDAFVLVHAYADDQEKLVYALVRTAGEKEPRLYKVSGNFDKNRKAFAKAQVDLNSGKPMSGRHAAENGDDGVGTYVFYVTPPANLPPKDPDVQGAVIHNP